MEKLEHMVENNERLIDMISGQNNYSHKEKTSTEMAQINANRKQKMLNKMEATGKPQMVQR